ncbi:MAG: hypothetical protein E6Q76_12890 [Rhizobium sp.]|nr:MAG: hypothetical protein E6Q76_12890 [Rhizobium sp.]
MSNSTTQNLAQGGIEETYRPAHLRLPLFLQAYPIREGWRYERKTTSLENVLPRLAAELQSSVSQEPSIVGFVHSQASLINKEGLVVASGSTVVPMKALDMQVGDFNAGLQTQLHRIAESAALQRLMAASGFRGDIGKAGKQFDIVRDGEKIANGQHAYDRFKDYFERFPIREGWRVTHEVRDLDDVYPSSAASMLSKGRIGRPDLAYALVFTARLWSPEKHEAASASIIHPISKSRDFETGETMATLALFDLIGISGIVELAGDEDGRSMLDPILGDGAKAITSPMEDEPGQAPPSEKVVSIGSAAGSSTGKKKKGASAAGNDQAADVGATSDSGASQLAGAAEVKPYSPDADIFEGGTPTGTPNPADPAQEQPGVKNPYTDKKQAARFEFLVKQVKAQYLARQRPVRPLNSIEEAQAAIRQLPRPGLLKPAEATAEAAAAAPEAAGEAT